MAIILVKDIETAIEIIIKYHNYKFKGRYQITFLFFYLIIYLFIIHQILVDF